MANKQNGLLRLALFIVWTFLCVEIYAVEEFSGDMPYLKSMFDLPSNLLNITNTTSTPNTTDTNTILTKTKMNEITTAQATYSTLGFSTMTPTDQPSSTKGHNTTMKEKLGPTTASTASTAAVTAAVTTETTTHSRTEETTILKSTTKAVVNDKEKTELMTKLNGYKIATFCLAALLGIIFLIILIYFSAKSKTGHGDITNAPSTPPQDEENFPQTEEFKPVRLSSYFPHADKSPLKADLNENGDVEERKVTTFLTRKRQSVDDATGSQDKILHTSEL